MKKHPASNVSEVEVMEFNEGRRDNQKFDFVLSEADELNRIFYSSVQTARRNALNERRNTNNHAG